ncbi:outer membrane receptor protein involved in Fe transport [Algoriphagus boseongensis]|uniref:Outer membrane receptor protein involved in Fe transport n=2 Tax=Algoriphagus boseongensis TaxID=1442587 RepID=A0A4R6T714_9BACT|nr:outer membrane receptor protein involved in Fe transport [Algoriphagus boseongensis]
MMKKLGFLISFLLGVLPAIAQIQIKGKVFSKSDGIPLEFASVALYNFQDSSLVDGGITDLEGIFLIDKIPAGNYYLVASFLGFNSQTIPNLQVDRNQKIDLGIIFLDQDSQNLQAVEVEGQRISTDFRPEKQSFSAENFEAAQGGTATDVLKNLPGVSINGEGTLSIRGSSGFVVMINGRPTQGDPMMLLGQLPANSIEKVEWLSAPSAQYDSEGKAGIINITTKKGATDGLYLQFNGKLGFPSIENYDNKAPQQRYGGDFNLNYLKGKWDISFGASYQRNDQSGRRVGNVYTISGDTTTYFPSEGERSIDEQNYSGRFTVGYTPNPSNSLSLGFYAGVRDRIRTADILYYDNHKEFPGGETLPFQYFNANDQNRRGDFALGSLDYVHSFSNGSKLSTSLLYEYSMLGGPTINRNLGYPDLSIVYQDEYNTNDNPLNGVRYNLDYTFKPSSIGNFQVGYQYRFLDHFGDFLYERKNNESGIWEIVPEFSSEVDLKRIIHTGYIQWDKKREKWSYSAGVRTEIMERKFQLQDKSGSLDTTYLYDYIRPFFSGNITYQANKELTWKLNFTQRVERETTFKMNPFPEREHSETLEQGDPNVLPEFINTLEVGMVKTWKDNSFYATAYFTQVENLVNRVNTVYNDSILNRIYSNVGTAKSIGLELGTELFFTEKWKGYVGGNVYHYSIQGEFDNRPVDQAAWVYSYNFNTTYNFTKSLSSQFSLNYLSKRVTAQGEDSRFYQPSLNIRKTFLDGQLALNLVWQNIDLGVLKTNEQRITTCREGEFFTTTNYIYEVDMILLNLSYTINRSKNRAKFVKSEFGEKEF